VATPILKPDEIVAHMPQQHSCFLLMPITFRPSWLGAYSALIKIQKLEEDFIALPGSGEILFSDPSGIMRGERQRHLFKTNINIWIMIEVLGYTGNAVDEGNTVQESFKIKCAANGLCALRPVRDCF
jgi:hypothetical protein